MSKIEEIIKTIKLPHPPWTWEDDEVINMLETLRPYVELAEEIINNFSIDESGLYPNFRQEGNSTEKALLLIKQIKEMQNG